MGRTHRIVHEEAIVQVEGVMGGVVHQVEQRLEAARVDGRRRKVHAAQDAAHCVRYELRARCYPVVLLAAHLHHPASLRLEELLEQTQAPLSSAYGWPIGVQRTTVECTFTAPSIYSDTRAYWHANGTCTSSNMKQTSAEQ